MGLPAICSRDCHLLDGYKSRTFVTIQQRKATEDELENRMEDQPMRLPVRHECGPIPGKRDKLDCLVFASPDKDGNDELNCYLPEKRDANCDPLAW